MDITRNNTKVSDILNIVESQSGNLWKASLRKKASTPATIKPMIANPSEKKLSLLVSSKSLSTSTILYKKSRLNKTQMTAILKTR
jgi:hypothetical protein